MRPMPVEGPRDSGLRSIATRIVRDTRGHATGGLRKGQRVRACHVLTVDCGSPYSDAVCLPASPVRPDWDVVWLSDIPWGSLWQRPQQLATRFPPNVRI